MHTKKSLQQISRSFMTCRLLLTAAELDIFPLLAPGPLSAAGLAQEMKADLPSLTIVLDALSALGFLAKTNGLYQTAPGLIPWLDEGSEESILPSLKHAAHMWTSWSKLSRIVLEGREASGDIAPVCSEDRLSSFIGAMAVGARGQAEDVAAAIPRNGAANLLDIGGGPGSYTAALLKAWPGARATLFDLKPVVEIARTNLRAWGFEDRVSFSGGDFNNDELPRGFDLALLSAIIHMNSPRQNVNLFRKIYKSLNENGRLVIRDHVMDENRVNPPDGAIFAVNMLTATPGGSTYTLAEISAWLEAAGFGGIELLRRQGMSSMVSARRLG